MTPSLGILAHDSDSDSERDIGVEGRTVLPPGECHLWLVPVHRRFHWLGLLDQEEREQLERLSGSPAADVMATSRGAQRLVGARYLGVPPAEVVIERGCAHCARPGARHGRPRFRGSDLDYSVSHTETWVLIAVTGTGQVGVDIEELASAPEPPEELARAVLTPAELERFGRLAPSAAAQWVLSAWTRKEAAMKLAGLGLAASPRRLDVSGPTVSAATVPRWPDAAVHLRALPAPDGHVASLASTAPGLELRRFALPQTAAGPVSRVGATLS